MSLPDFTDLRQLSLALEGESKFKGLRSAIESAWRAQSCNVDLRQAAEACDALDALRKSPRQLNSIGRVTTENALLVTGLLLYARATGTSGQRGERGSIQLNDKNLTPEQRIDHKYLLEIRNRALAHVYPESPFWHEDIVFAVDLMEFGWKPAVASKRITFDAPTFARLRRQIPVADGLLMRAFHKRMDAMTQMLNEMSVPLDLFLKFRFDPVQKFGGLKSVKDVLAGIPVGHATIITKE